MVLEAVKVLVLFVYTFVGLWNLFEYLAWTSQDGDVFWNLLMGLATSTLSVLICVVVVKVAFHGAIYLDNRRQKKQSAKL